MDTNGHEFIKQPTPDLQAARLPRQNYPVEAAVSAAWLFD